MKVSFKIIRSYKELMLLMHVSLKIYQELQVTNIIYQELQVTNIINTCKS